MAMRYLQSHSQMYEKSYPYTSGTTKKSGECEYIEDESAKVRVVTESQITKNDIDAMKAALSNGVISVAIQAAKPVF